jgi:glutamate synthase (NADPH/NADH) large chain
VATLTGVASHDIVAKALTALRNLEHRGAAGAEPNSGDGAGILIQVPDAFLREVVDFELPPPALRRRHGLPARRRRRGRQDPQPSRRSPPRRACGPRLARRPGRPDLLGATARGVMPSFAQLFVGRAGRRLTGMALERLAFCLRKRAEHETDVYFPSLSARTLVYKGMLTTDQLDRSSPTCVDERVESALASCTRGSRPTRSRLAAGPPVPLHRAQRRDQHRDGQPQLDAGPRGAAGPT